MLHFLLLKRLLVACKMIRSIKVFLEKPQCFYISFLPDINLSFDAVTQLNYEVIKYAGTMNIHSMILMIGHIVFLTENTYSVSRLVTPSKVLLSSFRILFPLRVLKETS